MSRRVPAFIEGRSRTYLYTLLRRISTLPFDMPLDSARGDEDNIESGKKDLLITQKRGEYSRQARACQCRENHWNHETLYGRNALRPNLEIKLSQSPWRYPDPHQCT